MYVMSCVPQDKCGVSGSATIASKEIKMGISCCSGDLCTPSLPTLPRVNTVSNGLTCRSCISEESTSCYTSDTMQCTGDQNMCMLQTVQLSGVASGSSAMRGCATKSLCNLGSHSFRAQGLSGDIRFVCTSGSADLRKGFFLPAVICLFFLKLLI
ncbi:phospholipase A2 inhibitor NAI-like [Mantella aurantiaca]